MINKLKKHLVLNQNIAKLNVEDILKFGRKLAKDLRFLLFFRLLLKNARLYNQRFANLKGMNSDLKIKLLTNVRNFEIRFALSDIWENIISFPFLVVYTLISFVTLFGSPIVAIYIINNGSFTTSFTSSVFIILAIVLNFVNMILVNILLQFLTELIPTQQINISLPTLLLLLLTLIPWLLNNESQLLLSSVGFLILSSIIFQATFLFALAIALIGFTLGRIISLRLLRHYYPDSFIAHKLIKIIAELDDKSKSWISVEFRSQLIYEIEEISSCIEKDLSRALRSGDKVTDVWLKKTTICIASSFREKKKWILTPKVDTRDHLYNNLRDSLINFVIGNWDLLEQEEPMATSAKQIWIEQIRNLFRVLFVGGIPIILLWLIQNSVLALKTPFDNYAMIGTLLWAVFTMITTYDPLFSTKISALKDVMNLVPFIGNKP